MATNIPCMSCSRFDNQVRDKEVCSAFPNGIPLEIIGGLHLHREPFKGDNGIQWDAVKGAEWLDTPEIIEEVQDDPGMLKRMALCVL